MIKSNNRPARVVCCTHLAVLVSVGQEDLLHVARVRNDREGLGPEREAEDLAVHTEELVQRHEHRLADDLADVAARLRHALRGLGTPLAAQVGEGEREGAACVSDGTTRQAGALCCLCVAVNGSWRVNATGPRAQQQARVHGTTGAQVVLSLPHGELAASRARRDAEVSTAWTYQRQVGPLQAFGARGGSSSPWLIPSLCTGRWQFLLQASPAFRPSPPLEQQGEQGVEQPAPSRHAWHAVISGSRWACICCWVQHG